MSGQGQAHCDRSRLSFVSFRVTKERLIASEAKAAPGLDVSCDKQNLPQRLSCIVLIGLVIIGSARIVATYTVLSDTLASRLLKKASVGKLFSRREVVTQQRFALNHGPDMTGF